jgi:hypothetical protein
MERFSFLVASAAFCLFVTVAFTSAMTTDCLCDGLPGSQCDYCEHPEAESVPAMSDAGLQGQYYQAWQQEHDDFHRGWVLEHGEFHESTWTEQEHRDFHARMEDAHGRFHGILSSASGQSR